MTCADVQAGDIAEKYLLRELGEAESAAYEAHYFGCAECLNQLEMLESLRKELHAGRQAVSIKPSWRWIWPVSAAATVLLGAVLVWRTGVLSTMEPPSGGGGRPATAESPKNAKEAGELELLARVTPPVYQRSVTRAAGQPDERFEKAMEAYTSGDYRAAAQALAPFRQHDARSLAAAFYMGIAQMQLAQANQAAESFTEVIGRGDTLFLEQARLYRAKAYLRRKQRADALEDLRAAIALHGDREEEARELMRRVEAMQGAGR